MVYITSFCALIIVLVILFTFFFKNNKCQDNLAIKIVTYTLIALFVVRLFCYKSIIAESPDKFVGLDTSPLSSKVLTIICLLLIWFDYSALLINYCQPFFKVKVLHNIAKFMCLPILTLVLIFAKPILILLQGHANLSILTIIFGIETGAGIGISLYNLLTSIKEKHTLKEILLMLLCFFLISFSTLPSYFCQFVFGKPLFTRTWIIKELTPYHRYVLYGAFILPIVIYYLLKDKDEEFTRFILIYLNVGVLVGFVVNYNYKTIVSPWAWPFHLCNTALFVTPLVLIFKMKRLFYFTYFINVVGALLAMLMPNYGDATNILSMRAFNFWYNHYFAFFMPILLVSLKQFERPKLKQFIYSMVAFLGYFIIALFFNVFFSARGHTVDYFFINSNFVADKFGDWADKMFNITANITINNYTYEFHPLYQVVFFLVYVLIGLGVWFVYEEAYKLVDAHGTLVSRIKKIKIDEYALKNALQGRKMSEPMEKDAGIKYELKHFSKKYGSSNRFAVEDASLIVQGGEVFGFLGPNGAGKSTIIKTTVGIQPLTSGSINICGYDVATQPVEAKSLIGYVPDHYALYEKLTGREYVNYIADIYNVSKKDRDERIEKYVKLFQLEHSFDNMIKTYSHGMKQKITIMSALVHNPKVWILDEPLTGLDPNSIYQVKECMKEHAQNGNIVFFSSHLIDIVEKLCQRVAIIKHGHILCVKTLEEIENSGYTLEQFYLKMIGNEEE